MSNQTEIEICGQAHTKNSSLSNGATGRFASVIRACNFTLGDAMGELSNSLGQLRQIAAALGGDFKLAMDDVLMKMSAARTYEDTCMDEFMEEPGAPVKKQVSDLLTEAKRFTSIALALVDYYSSNGSP